MTDRAGIGGRTADELSEDARSAAGLWDAAGRDWAELVAPVATPVWHADLDAARVSRGTSVVDLGCGSGEALVLASLRGAETAGVDVSAGLLSIARERLPEADLRRGEIEDLPFDDGAFDAAIAANSISYADDPEQPLREAHRVLKPDGRVAVSMWGPDEAVGYVDLMRTMYELIDKPEPERFFPLGDAGAMEDHLEAAGFIVTESGPVDVPFVFPDEEIYLVAQAANGPAQAIIAGVGQEAFDEAVLETGTAFRRDDGSYRIDNEYRYVAGVKP